MSLCLFEASSRSPTADLIVGVYSIRNRGSNWAAVFQSLTKGAWSDHSNQFYDWAIFNFHVPMHMYVFYGPINVTDTLLEACDILK
jgi:hypothetical protein